MPEVQFEANVREAFRLALLKVHLRDGFHFYEPNSNRDLFARIHLDGKVSVAIPSDSDTVTEVVLRIRIE